MDMNEHPVAVDVAHFQVECLLETKPACVDSEEIGVVVGSTYRGEEFYDLLFGEDGGKDLRALSFQVAENVPLTMQDLLEKEFEGTVTDSQGCSRPLGHVATVEEVILKLLFGNQIRGLAIEIHQLAEHAGIGSPGTVGQSCQLECLRRSFVPSRSS